MIKYKPAYGSDSKYYVEGPGDGLGYYSGTLWPHLRFDDEELTKKISIIANIAYEEGYKQAQRDMRASLGIKS